MVLFHQKIYMSGTAQDNNDQRYVPLISDRKLHASL